MNYKSKLKRLLSILIVFSIILSMFTFCCMVYAEDQIVPENSNLPISFLDKLEIFKGIDDFNTDINRAVKRWEFMVICMNLTNSHLPVDFEDVFVDVPYNASYAPYVYGAYQKGWITLNNSRTFNPETEITLEQAIKVIVKITGFEAQAHSLSGYPVGYLDVAYRNNVLIGINIPSTGNMTFQLTAKLLYNLFDSPFAYPVGISDGIEYRYGEHTVYSYYHNLYKNKGILSAVYNGTTSVNSKELSKNEIEIDNQLFYTENNYQHNLGKKVEYLYFQYEYKDEKEILYLEVDKNNKELTLKKEDILEMTSESTLRYKDERGRPQTEKIELTVNVIYNNNYAVKTINFPKEKIKEAEEIRLLDNNGDGKWDFLFVEKSDYYFVDTVAPSSFYFNSFYGGYIDLSSLSSNNLPVITKDGKDAPFNSIKKYNVTQVKKNYMGSKIISIEVTSKDVSGKITSVLNDGNESYIYIDDIEYKVHDLFLNSGKYAAEIGQEVTVALDKNDEIVGYKKKSEDNGYGYIIDMWTVTNGLDYNLRIKMLNFEGELVTYEFADKFYVDSVRYKDNTKEILDKIILSVKETGADSDYIGGIYEDEASLIPNTIALKKGIHQLVIYNLDKEGKINKFDTVKADVNGQLTRDIMPKFHANTGTPSTRYLSAGYIIADLNSNSRFIMSADTLVFSVPVNGKDDPDNYLVGDRTLLPGLEYHTVHAYNVDPETMVAEVVIAEKGDAKNSGLQPEAGTGKRREFISITLDSTKYSVVRKVTQALDLNGDPATKVYVLNNKQEDYFFLSSDAFIYDYKEYKEKDEKDVSALALSSIKPGQVIANTVVPASKYAKTVCILGTPSQDINATGSTYIVGASGYDEYIFGRLVSKKNATIQAEILKEGNWITYGYNIGNSAEVYRCIVGGNVEPFDLSAINYELNRYVFIRSRVGKIPIVVVYDY